MAHFYRIIFNNFLGNAPTWYKKIIIFFLICNPILFLFSDFTAGWVVLVEFIFTLAMALQCYPLLPGGLLTIELFLLNKVSSEHVLHEIHTNLDVFLLLIFMVSGIYFMRNLLLFIFSFFLVKIESKIYLSILFFLLSAILSAFLDALTVIAVIISVAVSFYKIYTHVEENTKNLFIYKRNESISETRDFIEFQSFLCGLLMHCAIGTAVGGIFTKVGEPQNLIIAEFANWDFIEFMLRTIPISSVCLILGLLTCITLERFKLFGYGQTLPTNIKNILSYSFLVQKKELSNDQKYFLIVQSISAILLVIALLLHLATVGLIGLAVIIFCTSFCGINKEHDIGIPFSESLPFVSLLVVFFCIVSMILDLNLFSPLIETALQFEGKSQAILFFVINGFLSMVSDNVFVGSVFISELKQFLNNGAISQYDFELLAVIINVGTNIPSIATPNGQAALLFLLTSPIAPLIRLSYVKMMTMAFPYLIILNLGCLYIIQFEYLDIFTKFLYFHQWIQ